MKGWMISVGWMGLYFTNLSLALPSRFADEFAGSELGEGSRESPDPEEPIEEPIDDMEQLAQVIKNASGKDELVLASVVLGDYANRGDPGPVLQVLSENLSRNDLGTVIETTKRCLDDKDQIVALQILDEHLWRNNLSLSALSEEDRKFVEECTPEGCQSETYYRLRKELSNYCFGQELASDTTPGKLDHSSERKEGPDGDNQAPGEELILGEKTSGLEATFAYSVAQEFKSEYTLGELRRMNIDLVKLLQIELAQSLCQRVLTAEEKLRFDGAICALDRSPEQRLLNAITSVSCTPKTSLQRVKSIVEEEDVDLNSQYKGLPFLVKAAGIWKDRGLPIVEFLLDNGADIEITDRFGRTALFVAARYGNLEVARLLIERGTNVNAVNKDGETPLFAAWVSEYPEIVELLIDNGAGPETQGDAGNPFFTMAIKRRMGKCVKTEREVVRHHIAELQSPSI
jgi:hypothetical protein